MADEAERIDNPTNTPEAVSTGYQAQNLNMIAQRNGLDGSVVEASGVNAILQISGPVDVDGELYIISSAVSFSLSVAGRYYIHLAGTGANLTPVISSDSGDMDTERNARYTTAGYRVLNWCIDSDGSSVTVNKLFTPAYELLGEAINSITNLPPFHETFITASGTWVCPVSNTYIIEITANGGAGGAGGTATTGTGGSGGGGAGGSGLFGTKQIFIPAGESWTATFSTSPGGYVTFANGTTTLSAQNGSNGSVGQLPIAATGGAGGAGGTGYVGFDFVLPGVGGDPGHEGYFNPDMGGNGGTGGGPFGGGGGAGSPSHLVPGGAGSPGSNGCGGGGGGGGNASGVSGYSVGGAGGAGGTGYIKITG